MEQENDKQIAEWVDSVERTWKGWDVKLNKGASEAEIVKVELVTGIVLSPAMEQLYKRVNGFLDWNMSDNMFSIWSLDRICEQYIELNEEEFVGFSDYMIMAHFIGFIKGREGVFKDYERSEAIAGSFMEAIDLINCDSALIY